MVNSLISEYMPPGSLDEQWDVPGLEEALTQEYGLEVPVGKWLDEDDELHEETLRDRILESMISAYKERKNRLSRECSDILRRLSCCKFWMAPGKNIWARWTI